MKKRLLSTLAGSLTNVGKDSFAGHHDSDEKEVIMNNWKQG